MQNSQNHGQSQKSSGDTKFLSIEESKIQDEAGYPTTPQKSPASTTSTARLEGPLGKRLAKESGFSTTEKEMEAETGRHSTLTGSSTMKTAKRMRLIQPTHKPGAIQPTQQDVYGVNDSNSAQANSDLQQQKQQVSAPIGMQSVGASSSLDAAAIPNVADQYANAPTGIVSQIKMRRSKTTTGRTKTPSKRANKLDGTPGTSTPRKTATDGEEGHSNESDEEKKKDKKLVFLSRSVLQKVRERPMVTGTQIANEILEMYKKFCDIGQKVDFKNVQRRVYDALNVLSAMDIIRKDKYNIIYNHYNEHIPADFGFYESDDEEDIVPIPNANLATKSYEQGGLVREKFVLTPEMVDQREKEQSETRRRIREKQKLLIELIKQQVSITKLKQRNIEVANKLLNDQDGGINVDKSVAHQNQKLQLPLLFVECQPDSRIKISQDDTKMHLKLSTDRKFTISDENFLFDFMGFTNTTSEELSQMFDGKIIDFLKRSELVQALPKQGGNKPQQVQTTVESGEDVTEMAVCGDEGVSSAHHATANTAAVKSASYHTPITKYLHCQSSPKTAFQQKDLALAAPFELQNELNGGQASIGTHYSTNGSHQALFQGGQTKKSSMAGLRV